MSSNISSSHINYYSNMYSENKIFAIIKVRNKKKWTKEEDIKLIKLAERNKEKHWKEISKNFQNKNPLQCFSRYKRIKPGIIKGTWSKEEDEKILSLVKIYGKSWSKLAKIMKSRNGKQIRDRFINVLDPEVKKGKFSYKEDKKIKELYLKYGPRWATIARGLPNRTPDMIKNRFHSSIKKYLHQKNFLSKCVGNSKINKNEQSSSKKTSSELLENSNTDILNKFINLNSFASSNGNYSNSNPKNLLLLDKNYPNSFSNYSCPIQESNYNPCIFDNKYNQLQSNSTDFDNRVIYGFNLSNSQQNKENNNNKDAAISIMKNQEFRNCQHLQYNKNFNFASTQTFNTEFANKGVIFNKIASKTKRKSSENNIIDDANRTVSNSDFSEGGNEKKSFSNLYLRDGCKNLPLHENIENLFEHPDEQFPNTNFLDSNSNNNAAYNNSHDNSSTRDIKVYGTANNPQNYNSLVSRNPNKTKSNYDTQQRSLMINNKNNNNNKNTNISNNNDMDNNKMQIIRKNKLEIKNENPNLLIESKLIYQASISNNTENLNRTNSFNFNANNILKNVQEFKIEKTNKNSADYNFPRKSNQSENTKIEVNYELINNKLKLKTANLNIQSSSNEFEIKSDVNKPNQLFSNENSQSTNQVSFPNASSNTSSNIYLLEKNENSSPEKLNYNKVNGNPYFLNNFEENYQMNFLSFPDSPFRMKSPKYFDFEDFFNNN